MAERKSGCFGQRKRRVEDIALRDLDVPWNFYHVMMSPPMMMIRWLMTQGLIMDHYDCSHCNVPCHIIESDTIDGCTWRCPSDKRHLKSIRFRSFFTKSKLYIQDVMQFILTFAHGLNLYANVHICGMNYKSTALNWASYLREILMEWVHVHLKNVRLHGEIEIDESLFGRRSKYHRGCHRGVKVWILGMVERASNRLLLFPIEDRSADTLIQLIRKHVHPGSTIYTDSWRGYATLNDIGFQHFSVCHKYKFKQVYRNQHTGELKSVNTNMIEGAWAHAKGHFRQLNGTTISNFEGHLAEILFRNHNRNANMLESIVNAIKAIYTLNAAAVYTYSKPLFPTWNPGHHDHIVSSNEERDIGSMDAPGEGPHPRPPGHGVPLPPQPSTSGLQDRSEHSRRSEGDDTSSSDGPTSGRQMTINQSHDSRSNEDSPQSPASLEARPPKKRTIPHFCPDTYGLEDTEVEGETSKPSPEQEPPRQTSTRGRIIKKKLRKSFVQWSDDSDFI